MTQAAGKVSLQVGSIETLLGTVMTINCISLMKTALSCLTVCGAQPALVVAAPGDVSKGQSPFVLKQTEVRSASLFFCTPQEGGMNHLLRSVRAQVLGRFRGLATQQEESS